VPIPGNSTVDELALVGSTLADRFRLLEVIGEGGMGQVFRAEKVDPGEAVALKLLHPEFSGVDQAVQRFQREGTVTTQLSHPHIVKFVEFGQWNGRLYLAMELLAGKSLAELIARDRDGAGKRMTVRRTTDVMRPVWSALHYAHSLGVVHRDLKPENIMVIPARGLFSREQIKLLDFGIAKLAEGGDGKTRTSATTKLTQAGLVLGTPGYMAPEQAMGQAADVRSDIYSCGVILYEMLTGDRPFEADTGLEIITLQLTTQPRPFHAVAPEVRIPPAVERVVRRALAKEPSDRFQSVRELQDAFETAVDDQGASALINGTEKTVLAMPAARSKPSPWTRLAIIGAALGILLGEHLPPAAANRARTPAGGDSPVAAREPAERPKAARDAAEHGKHNVNHARATSKNPAVRVRRP
jgi:serine/threonine protein kinase